MCETAGFLQKQIFMFLDRMQQYACSKKKGLRVNSYMNVFIENLQISHLQIIIIHRYLLEQKVTKEQNLL